MTILLSGTSAISSRTIPRTTLSPTSSTAPTRPSSRGRCRSCCESQQRTGAFAFFLLLFLSLFFYFLPFFLSARDTNTAFKETLKQIDGSAECGGLPMISFLILPMQRVTRLPLLLDVSLTLLIHNAQATKKTKQSAPTHRKLLMVPSLRFLNGGTGCCLQNDIISTVPLKVSFFFFFCFPHRQYARKRRTRRRSTLQPCGH